MPKKKNLNMPLTERPKPESYSKTVAMRCTPSEKEIIDGYTKDRNTTIDTVIRSALVQAGVLPKPE